MNEFSLMSIGTRITCDDAAVASEAVVKSLLCSQLYAVQAAGLLRVCVRVRPEEKPGTSRLTLLNSLLCLRLRAGRAATGLFRRCMATVYKSRHESFVFGVENAKDTKAKALPGVPLVRVMRFGRVLFVFLALENFDGHVVDSAVVRTTIPPSGRALYVHHSSYRSSSCCHRSSCVRFEPWCSACLQSYASSRRVGCL